MGSSTSKGAPLSLQQPQAAKEALSRAFKVPLVPVIVGVVLLAVAVGVSLTSGAAGLEIAEFVDVMFAEIPGVGSGSHLGDPVADLLWQIRFPRTVLALMVGAALSVAGASYQGVFHNPLADPYLLGASAGAGVGAVLALGFGVQFTVGPFEAVPLAAFVGALLAVAGSVLVARGSFFDPSTLLLAGVAVSSLCSATQAYLLQQLDQTRSREVLSWIFGRLAGDGWTPVVTFLPYFVVSVVVLLPQARWLDVLRLGDEQARSLGVNAARVRCVVIAAATFLTAAAVAVSGLIGFVGLVVPHVVRLVASHSYRAILPLSGLFGAGFLLLVDVGARTVSAPAELPIGVITAFVGAPFFAFILWRRKRVSV
ncbi:FecCD family ABC transporter permease [Dermatophilus congolensis]|nr:iron ABC transporter permease [Dermatophilus congolensis]MBO3129139.1 iron ABC transporter permease [Dermatophilus congolensis]MBO3132224.1 iron ABC transporter permease [Dermatophilus congolensis]MBO3133615.1 iron ABC transporter permease [Dermatophilus congolensis]MBO3135848.1 iron ABC transporter permease [Dermatophilus congolensis]MBO3138090.1 iron ABC transporter permease [Dermatophilus congolensis]